MLTTVTLVAPAINLSVLNHFGDLEWRALRPGNVHVPTAGAGCYSRSRNANVAVAAHLACSRCQPGASCRVQDRPSGECGLTGVPARRT